MPKHTIVENTVYSVADEQAGTRVVFTSNQTQTLYSLFDRGYGFIGHQYDHDDKNIAFLIEKGLVCKRYVQEEVDEEPGSGGLAFCLTSLGYTVALSLFSVEQLSE